MVRTQNLDHTVVVFSDALCTARSTAPTARIEVNVYASCFSPPLGTVLIYKGLFRFAL